MEVKKEAISKCFRKAGILDDNFAVVSREHEAQDPFDEWDSIESTDDELDNLIQQLNMHAETRCLVHEYVNEAKMIFPLVLYWMMKRGKTASDQLTEQEEPEDVTFDLEPPPPKYITLVRLSSHLNMFEPFLTEKDTLIRQQRLLLLYIST